MPRSSKKKSAIRLANGTLVLMCWGNQVFNHLLGKSVFPPITHYKLHNIDRPIRNSSESTVLGCVEISLLAI